jgi:hypothetical protein
MRIINTVTGQPDEIGIDAGQYLSANISEVCVPKKLGGDIVSHHVHKQLSDFATAGDPVYDAFTAGLHASGTNDTPAWTANNAAFIAAAASGTRVEIPSGVYYVSAMLTFATGTSFVGLGGGVWIVYGPAFTGTFLATPLAVCAAGASEISLEKVRLHGVNHTAGILRCNTNATITCSQCYFSASDNDHYAVHISDGNAYKFDDCYITDSLFATSIYGTSEIIQGLSFRRCAWKNSGYNAIHIRNAFTVIIDDCTSDQNPVYAGNVGPKTVNGVVMTCANDARGILIQEGGTSADIQISNSHIENSCSITSTGIGIEDRVGSAVVHDSVTIPGGWEQNIVLGGGNYWKSKTGYVVVPLLQESDCHAECRPSVSFAPTAVTWGAGSGVTTATTSCVQYFDAPGHRGGANLRCSEVKCVLSRAGGTETGTLELVGLNNRTGTISVLASFALSDGDNTFTARINNYGQMFDASTPLWDGQIGDPTDRQFGGTNMSFAWRVTTTPGGGGSVTIRQPRITYSTGTPMPAYSLQQLDGVYALIRGHFDETSGGPDLSNHGTAGGNWVNHGATTAIGASAITCDGVSTWAEMTLPAKSAWTLYTKLKLNSTTGNHMVLSAYGSTTPSAGDGVVIAAWSGTWRSYTHTGGLTDLGVGLDTATHSLIISWNGTALTAWLDGTLIIAPNTALVPSIATKLLLGTWDGSSNFANVTFTNPAMLDHAVNAREVAYLAALQGI